MAAETINYAGWLCAVQQQCSVLRAVAAAAAAAAVVAVHMSDVNDARLLSQPTCITV